MTREEVRLREMTSRLGESHPQLIEQEARLSELRAKLAAEKGRAVSNVSFGNSATQSRVAQISSALEAQRAKVLRMQSQREQSVGLQREVERAQRAFDTMQQRVSQASIESQNTQTNLSVLKHATRADGALVAQLAEEHRRQRRAGRAAGPGPRARP